MREDTAVVHLPKPLHKRLKEQAAKRGVFLQKLIEDMLILAESTPSKQKKT